MSLDGQDIVVNRHSTIVKILIINSSGCTPYFCSLSFYIFPPATRYAHMVQIALLIFVSLSISTFSVVS